MAVAYHCKLKPISRSAGRSATAAIAYRAGERVIDERTGLIHDYTRRRGVEHTEIFLPENAPVWASQRDQLWNAAEQAETRKNSTVAREFIIAFPAGLTKEQRHEAVSEFANSIIERHGVAVDVAIHTPDKEGDYRNHHAHILFSTRKLETEGFTKKTRELDDLKTGPVLTVHWKKQWAELCATSLRAIGQDVEAERWRYGYLSLGEQVEKAKERGDLEYVAQNEGRKATVHLGPNVVSLERQGIKTERGDAHRNTQEHNALVINLAEVRQSIAAAREANERDNGNGRDRTSDRVAGRDVTRANAERSGRTSDKPNIGRPGVVPPPFARSRLRNLSELGVVRFPERGEVLLPRDVPRNVEHERAEPDNALRRADNGLTGEKPNTRELIQRKLTGDLLRRAVADREPIKAANDPSPEVIKREWKDEKARQFTLIVNRAKVLHARTAGQMERQEGRLQAIDQQRPAEPSGLLASFKKAAHDQAISAWRGVRAGLERRWTQLNNRLNLIGDYMRKAGPYEQPTRGELLAEKKAAQARPELATNFQQVIEKEKAARIAAQRAKIDQRRHGKHQEREMKQESIEELKQRIDTNREKADKAERNELDKAGRLASLHEQNAEQKYDENQIAKTQADTLAKELNAGTDKGDQTKEARKRELLKAYQEKAARDRDNDRGRGR
ncbi:MobQ family relaxase [Pseudomonas aeruginosa]|uniref:MobQ family relaxase n=1 Tax=Pseudomonas aeruginosa TaxID=287 RepID=UPI000EB53FAF|nr:MobQ family relaxase [Pseudomonas aeruginosa]HDP3820655.1 MobA/MobL family protein [Pseudomonas aeruginosa]